MGHALHIQRAAGALGAFISGPALQEYLNSSELFARLLELAIEYEVIFLRDQDVSPVVFQTFAQQFGEVLDHPAYPKVPEAPLVQILESTAAAPSKIEVWHSDMTFSATPPSFTILHGQIIPEFGGDTLWSSATAAYASLSEPMKGFFSELRAVHDFRHGFKESLAEPGGAERLAAAIAENPPVEHPIVRTHPISGKKSVYVNPLFTTHITGLSKLESERLLTFLHQHSASAEFTVRLAWAAQTIAIWDNRSVQHKPINDYFPQTRRLHRITIKGDDPK